MLDLKEFLQICNFQMVLRRILCEIFLGLECLLLDCKGYIAWGAIVTTLVVLIPLFMCFKSRNNKKRSRLKIEALEKELAGKEREINVLEKELVDKKRGKFIKRWRFHTVIEDELCSV